MDVDRDATQRYDYVQVPARTEGSGSGNGSGSSNGSSSGFTPARNSRSEYSNGNASDEANGSNGVNRESSGGSNVLTEAQRGAILAIANKVFGRTTKEEMAKLVDKPISQLTKSEASSLIDRLRAMLPEQPQSGRDERTGNANVREYAEARNGSSRN
jgi:hypothetical protein